MSTSSFIERLIGQIRDASWPSSHRTDSKVRRIYEQGLDLVNSFRGKPDVFLEALRAFQATQSAGYAYAGIAYTLIMVSAQMREQVGQLGFEEGFKWLEKAQEWEPDRVEINFIEAVLYLEQKGYDNARLVLDYLLGQDPNNFYVCMAEMSYWRSQGDYLKCVELLNQANKSADSAIRQAYTLTTFAGLLFDQGNYPKAINAYREVVKLTPKDPWAWHNMSLAFLHLQKFEEAQLCNQRALEIMDTGAGRELQELIKQKRPGKLQRLLGR